MIMSCKDRVGRKYRMDAGPPAIELLVVHHWFSCIDRRALK